MNVVRQLAFVVNGRLGGRDEDAWNTVLRFLDNHPVDVICAQGTGMDEGPYRLGTDRALPIGWSHIEPLLRKLKEKPIPFIMSLGGSAGADTHRDDHLRVISDICRECGLRFKVGLISGEIDKDYLRKKIRQGVRIPRSMKTPRLSEFLTEEEVDQAVRIQAQMGAEPVIKALQLGVDGVLTGRALDVGICMAYPLLKGIDPAIAAHAGKVIECGSMAAEPAINRDFVYAELTDSEFRVRPTNPALKCTVRSVAAHSLHERENPFEERMPGLTLDLSDAVFEQVDERTVRSSGARIRRDPYTVKLEGVRSLGFQSVTIMAVRDPAAIAHLDQIIEGSWEFVKRVVVGDLRGARAEAAWHVFGRDGVLGVAEPNRGTAIAHEVVVMITVLADDQKTADRVGYAFGKRMFQADFPGRHTQSGNVAFPTQPITISAGESFGFHIWHLLPLEDPCEPFRTNVVSLPLEGTIQ
jgi:hypothetical protein